MALRIRADGRVLCAAMHGVEPGDTYLDDATHYHLSVDQKVLVSEPMVKHEKSGQWWWAGNIPEGVEIDDVYQHKDTGHENS